MGRGGCGCTSLGRRGLIIDVSTTFLLKSWVRMTEYDIRLLSSKKQSTYWDWTLYCGDVTEAMDA
jgi:hypothetical protein